MCCAQCKDSPCCCAHETDPAMCQDKPIPMFCTCLNLTVVDLMCTGESRELQVELKHSEVKGRIAADFRVSSLVLCVNCAIH